MTEFVKLNQYLTDFPTGPISDKAALEPLLAVAWDQLGGSSDGGMNWEKLFGRMENVVWQPPKLNFVIERHGGTVNGSSRADLQFWSLNLETRTATLEKVSKRQLDPMQRRLEVEPLAVSIADLIANGQQHEMLKWYSPKQVRVRIGTILPKYSAVKQTLAGRRKRFWKMMIVQMEAMGWNWLGRGVFKKGNSGS